MLYVKVERIRQNPWQTRRQGGDDEGLQELVADIESRRTSRATTKGLLQVPAGRLVTAAGKPVARDGYTEERAGVALSEGELYLQLAYGHRRLAAFRSLAENDNHWQHMPVELAWFDDEEMATSAWSENWERRDLTPMEQARAIALVMEDFGWTQKLVAEKLGLDRSTVANKLRLLKLPVELRLQVQEGTLAERQALALLPLTELPEAAVESLSSWSKEDAERLVEKADELSSGEIRSGVKGVVEAATEDLEKADFPLAFEVLLDERTREVTCQLCDHRFSRGGKQRCGDPVCFGVRTMAWRRGVLAPIGEELGIPVLDPEKQAQLGYSDLAYFWHEADLNSAREEACENLRVAWRNHDAYAAVDGHEQAQLVCLHGRGNACSCKNGRNREAEEERKGREKARRAVVKEAKAALIEILAEALDAGETAALRAVLVKTGNYGKRDDHRAIADRARIVQKLAKIVVGDALWWSQLQAGEMEEKAAEWLQGMELNGHEGPRADAQLADLQHRWERIQGWMQGPLVDLEAEGQLPVEAIQGNIDNLERLLVELGEGELTPEAEDLVRAISDAAYQLEGMV